MLGECSWKTEEDLVPLLFREESLLLKIILVISIYIQFIKILENVLSCFPRRN